MARLLATIAAFMLAGTISGHEIHMFDTLEVEGRGTPLVGEAVSASEGYVGQIDLESRPLLRTGEILETIPGLVVTQHSGSGKANQYFLRGFNLDHGTDFSTSIDGMPVNLVTHGHGQGYTDFNFVIPELVANMNYLKGSYYAGVGNFSSAGSVAISTVDSLESGLARITVGEDSYFRALVADSQQVGEGDLLFALERNTNNGPWDLDENLDKLNGQLKYTQDLVDGSFSVSLMGYDSSWDSTDQIPERAVSQGLISDLGFLDDSVGGESSRYSLSTNWLKRDGDAATQVSAYAISYDMNLWSNFTYFLEDPVQGDQFEQADDRMIYGLSASRLLSGQTIFDRSVQSTFGAQVRYDDIDNVGLYRTAQRQRLSSIREDSVKELAMSVFYDALVNWSGRFKTVFGLRADRYAFDVNSDLSANSGSENDFRLSPKFNAVYAVNENAEYYFSAGYGFHSNDARGTTIAIDPADGVKPVDPVDPLVGSKGAEIGARFHWFDNLNTSVAVWGLRLDSELLYVGDAGSTEASDPSERFGIELANHYAASEWMSFDFDLAVTDASLRVPGSEDEIPGAVDSVASAGVSFNPNNGWFGSLRFRHFGDRPLNEDGSVQSGSFSAFNARLGYKAESWWISLDLLNAFDSDSQDITYFYESRLPGEPAEGVADRHYHIIEPRSARLNFSWRF
jgi:hypothetical protein